MGVAEIFDWQRVHKLVGSIVLYNLACNSLLYGVPENLLRKVQLVQNAAARLRLRTQMWPHHSTVAPVTLAANPETSGV